MLGFDKASGAVRQEWRIARDCEQAMARILRVDANRLAVVDPRALTPRQATRIGTVIGQRIEAATLDYFIQAFDEAAAIAPHRPEAPE